MGRDDDNSKPILRTASHITDRGLHQFGRGPTYCSIGRLQRHYCTARQPLECFDPHQLRRRFCPNREREMARALLPTHSAVVADLETTTGDV